MKNLKNISYEVLDNLPTKTSSQIYYKNFVPYRDKVYHYHTDNEIHYKIKGIINNSVGKSWESIFNKLRPAFKQTSYNWVPILDIRWYISDNYDIDSKGERHYKNHWGGYEKQRHRMRNSRTGVKYVDENGIIQEEKFKIPKVGVHDNRQFYAAITDRKRRYKQDRLNRKRVGDVLLSMLNNPGLFKYYSKLVTDRNWYMKKIFEYSREKRSKDDKFKKYWKNWTKHSIKDYKEKVAIMDEQIAKLEAKDFNIYYSSRVYLYSIGKECHHMESPIKKMLA